MSEVSIRTLMKEGNEFVPVEQFNWELEDGYYVDGAIEIIIDGSYLCDVESWDHVDHLWYYILQNIENIENGNDVKILWPDQPLVLTIERASKEFLLVKHRGNGKEKLLVHKVNFISSLVHAAEIFFKLYGPSDPTWGPSDEVALLKRLVVKY